VLGGDEKGDKALRPTVALDGQRSPECQAAPAREAGSSTGTALAADSPREDQPNRNLAALGSDR